MVRRLAVAVALTAALIAPSAPVAADDVPIYAYARKLANGKVELALRVGDNAAQFPRSRMYPYATAAMNEPLRTSAVTVNHPIEGPIEMKVAVVKQPSGDLWVAPTTNDPDIAIVPMRDHVFSYQTAKVGEWWRSDSATLFSQRARTELRAPASWFPPPGQCAGAPHNPDSIEHIAICTPPRGATTVQEHLDAFLAMLMPHWPWIEATLNWSGGYTISHSLCFDKAAGCYLPGDRRVVLAADALKQYPMWFVEETLIHELAHAFDYMATTDSLGLQGRPSTNFMIRHPKELRSELFADAMTALVLDDRTNLGYYRHPHHSFSRYWDDYREYFGFDSRADFDAMIDQVPDRPTMWDRIMVRWALSGWCIDNDIGHSDCIGPREVIWPDGPASGLVPRWPSIGEILEGLPRVPNINVTIDYGCLDEIQGRSFDEILEDPIDPAEC